MGFAGILYTGDFCGAHSEFSGTLHPVRETADTLIRVLVEIRLRCCCFASTGKDAWRADALNELSKNSGCPL